VRRSRARRVAARALLAASALGLTATLVGPAPVSAESVEADYSIEAWFARSKPTPPQVEVPGQGPVSPGDATPAPQAANGNFAVSSAGGPPGDEQGDLAWTAFQWDLLDAIGGTVERFVVTLTVAPNDNRDFGDAKGQIRACNAKEPFGGAPGANAWNDRPEVDCADAVAPKVKKGGGFVRYTFDVTDMAATWAEGSGHGLVIVPGDPDDEEASLTPFQVTFAGYGTKADEGDEVAPKAVMEFTPAAGLEEGGSGFDDVPAAPTDTGSGSADLGSTDSGSFGGDASVDVFPDDVGSDPTASEAPAQPGTEAQGGDESASETAAPIQRTATHGTFPMVAWLLLPLAALAFFYTGTALGPAGDPVAVREGGVSRVLAQRRAARAAGELPPIDVPQ
jgi:hypothetical protein